MRIGTVVLALGIAMALTPQPAMALTDEEIFEAFQFNFSLPGARSAAMGRSFIGLADDATAAVSNPAGLTTLRSPEVALEVKLTDHSVERIVGNIDSDTPDSRIFGNAVPQLSFLGLVYGVKGLSVGIYRYETFNFDEQFTLNERPGCRECGTTLPKTDASVDMTVSNWGGSVAFRLPKNLSFGISTSAALLDMETRTTRFEIGGAQISQQSLIDDVAWGLSATLGGMYRPSEAFSAGLFFAFNPDFTVTEELFDPNKPDVDVFVKVPDRIGAGVQVRPIDELTAVFDVLYVQYSQQTGSNFRTLLRFPDLDPQDFHIDDVWEVHGGLEYAFLTTKDVPIAARIGAFTNPGHPLQYSGPTDTAQGKEAEAAFVTDRGTDLAFTFGLGAVFADYLQADVAYLNATQFEEITASVIFHFK